MSTYQHLLLATDLSQSSHEANEQAAILAKAFNARLSLLHTVEPIPAYAAYTGIADVQDAIVEDAKKALRKLGEELGVPESDQRIELGPVKSRVLEAAKELGIDLIIIGSHGRHGLSRLLESSAGGIPHDAMCDVLTVRCSEEEGA